MKQQSTEQNVNKHAGWWEIYRGVTAHTDHCEPLRGWLFPEGNHCEITQQCASTALCLQGAEDTVRPNYSSGGSGPQLHSPHSYQELWQLWFMPLLYHCFHRTNLGTEYRRELPAASHQVIINTQGVMVLQLQGTRSPARDRLKPSCEKKRKPSPWLPQRSKKAEG